MDQRLQPLADVLVELVVRELEAKEKPSLWLADRDGFKERANVDPKHTPTGADAP